jgi:hypothetical protein
LAHEEKQTETGVEGKGREGKGGVGERIEERKEEGRREERRGKDKSREGRDWVIGNKGREGRKAKKDKLSFQLFITSL